MALQVACEAYTALGRSALGGHDGAAVYGECVCYSEEFAEGCGVWIGSGEYFLPFFLSLSLPPFFWGGGGGFLTLLG